MNDWLLAGIVAVGTAIALGGGGWIMNVLTRKKEPPKV